MKAFTKLSILLPIASTAFYLLAATTKVQAQQAIVPDNTLPTNSVVTPNGNTLTITGGTTSGTNLFHSFSSFNVPTGGTAWFNNDAQVQNILTRVTGNSLSNINGLIRANGGANLFLINPAGIIFGSGASLNIGGSFVASTASSIKFPDGSEFSATNPTASPLLTINVPMGLQLGTNPAPIVVQGRGSNLRFDPATSAIIRNNRTTGMQVAPGKTLALVGGDIALEGGNITADGGRIELWAVNNGSLGISNSNGNLAISNPQATEFADIRLTGGASADTSGNGGGAIQVQGRQISLRDGSAILATTLGTGDGEGTTVRATESVQVRGSNRNLLFPSIISTSSQAGSSGKAGDITIETPSLLVGDGARLSTATFGPGNAGNMTLRANSTEVFGTLGNLSPSGLFTIAAFGSSGDAGDLTIETQSLRLKNGARIQSSTTGDGDGGHLTIKATEAVEVTGFADLRNPSFPTTPFIVGSVIASSVTRRGVMGDAGDMMIETARLTLKDGGQIVSSTFGVGKGGELIVKASNSVELIGTTGTTPTVISTLAATAGPNSTGKAGDVTINTGQLTIRDRARATVSNQAPTGTAGNLVVKADSIRLSGGGSLSADTTAGDRGNITIDSRDIFLRNNSRITTNAQGTATGGNITINTDFLVAVSPENSDITANAQQGSGGRVFITATGIFGTGFRDRLTPNSDITATSELGPQFNGIVQINTPDVNPAAGLLQLPADFTDASNQISESCSAQARTNSFTVTGRGGLPPNPEEALNSTPGWIDWRVSGQGVGRQGGQGDAMTQPITHYPLPITQIPIIEATNWVVDADGTVELVAAPAAKVFSLDVLP
jgi:filamentous hemagglutinin family protein